MSGFRSLAEGEVVEMETQMSGKGVEATIVTGPEGADCKGSSSAASHQGLRQQRRPAGNGTTNAGAGQERKKNFRKVRCYNCGEFASHVAAKCTLGPLPKRCHQCKSTDHLIADCPERPERTTTTMSEGRKDEKEPVPTDSHPPAIDAK